MERTADMLAFGFPGQGSQRPDMIASVPENDTFSRLLDAAEALSDLELQQIALMGGPEDLADTRVAQPLLYLCDWAWGIALLDSGVVPDVVAGHSLGELAALSIAGVFSVEAGLELVIERSKLMAATAAASPGSMSAVLGLDAQAVRSVVDPIEDVWVANDNSAVQVVISGTVSAVERASTVLTDEGARKVVPLAVAGPFHSPLMEPARSAFAEILAAAEFNDATIPVLQNTDPVPETDADAIRDRLVGQITGSVRWTETMSLLTAGGDATLVEAGPGSVLKGLARGVTGLTALSVDEIGLERVAEEVL